MLSENYKEEAFALLEKMSDTELEEVLLKDWFNSPMEKPFRR